MDCPGIKGPGEAISVEDMRAYEINAVYMGMDLDLLMENAGRAVADAIECILGGVDGARVVVFAGKGGNGGDGIVAARHLASRGARVEVHLSHGRESISHASTARNLRVLVDMGYARLIEPRDSRWGDPGSADVVVDGLLGIGVRGGLREPILTLARAFSEHQGLRVSIDTPTGVDPDTGNIAPGAVVADVTVTLHKAKRGLLAERARLHTGELLVADIGLPGKAEEVAGPGDYVARIPPRPRDAHKGVGGKVLIVGGSERYIGAPMLAALAAARAGADLVYLASPSRAAEEAAARSSTVLPIRLGGGHLSRGHVDEVLRAAERVHSIVVGPGLGDYGEALEAASILIERLKSKPIVVDADGLKALDPGICREGCGALVMTPHRGEAARLLGSPGEPRAMAEELARTYRATVLLKGPTDYICGPSRCRLNRSGTPNMSVGGTGDVLSGVIAAFLARRTSLGRSLDPLNTAAAAAYITGRAGELAVEAVGENISALDVIEKINNAIQEARGVAAGHGQR